VKSIPDVTRDADLVGGVAVEVVAHRRSEPGTDSTKEIIQVCVSVVARFFLLQ
jgi:hypothetical protein